MHVWALTGGIATGKSTVCAMLRAQAGVSLFDCDAAVKRMLEADAGVAGAILGEFGERALTAAGAVDRAYLRGLVFADASARRRLEGILHPRVREECLDSLGAAAKQGAALFVADVPLLFEKGFQFGQQGSLLVAVSRDTQVRRLQARDGFDRDLIDAILAAQLPIQDKLSLADVVFWNEGPEPQLRAQVRRFTQSLIRS